MCVLSMFLIVPGLFPSLSLSLYGMMMVCCVPGINTILNLPFFLLFSLINDFGFVCLLFSIYSSVHSSMLVVLHYKRNNIRNLVLLVSRIKWGYSILPPPQPMQQQQQQQILQQQVLLLLLQLVVVVDTIMN